ncbi:MAG: FkbM family methyltransferase [Gemmatimonadaceae bacterium]
MAHSPGRCRGDEPLGISAWFDDSDIVRQFPPAYRAYAAYCRRMAEPSKNVIRGGSFLLRALIRLTRAAGLSDHVGVRVGREDRVIFLDLLDQRMLWALGEVREHSGEARVLRRILREGDTFLDVGANHGSYSVIAAGLVGASGTVIAFEPQPRLAELVRRSLAASSAGHWEVHALACGETRGTAEFFVPSEGSGSASLFESFLAGRRRTRTRVRTVLLDEAIAWTTLPGQIFLKLDVEGSELAALHGALELLRRRQPTILIEINPASSAAAGRSVDEVLDFLSEAGYTSVSEVDGFPRFTPMRDLDRTAQRNVVVAHGSPVGGARP